jgi:CXXX repeat peptide maturase
MELFYSERTFENNSLLKRMNRLLSHLVVILDKHSTSFCYYENQECYASGKDIISLGVLHSAVVYARQNNLAVNFVYSNNRLPGEYEEIIESVNHVKIVPLKLKDVYPESVLVINRDDIEHIRDLRENCAKNIILRIDRDNLTNLNSIIISLLGKFKRLNLCLLNIEAYTEADLEQYSEQLKDMYVPITEAYKKGNSFEINFITDRFLLGEMNNCNAGITHLTLAPNSCFYLCPGFYYDSLEDNVGSLASGLNIKDAQLLRIDHAPVCRKCDAYHCKRCLYLNKRTTLEINTPSRQQCILSHLEREASRNLIEDLRFTEELRRLQPIPQIDYLDPFENLTKLPGNINGDKDLNTSQVNYRTGGVEMPDPENLTTNELLIQIYNMQAEILRRLG